MKLLKRILGVFVVLSGTIDLGLAKEIQPYRYALALQKLQDQIVLGNLGAHKAQRKMLILMGKSFNRARIADWQNRKNAEALLIFILSGGNPNFAIDMLSIKNQPNLPKGALAGALAFVSGERKLALKFLEPIKLEGLSTNIAAQIALARASLYAAQKDGRGRALEQLNVVRLLKPGTLLEEAALRRAIAVAGAARDKELFIKMSHLYTRRFVQSYYLKDFISNFSYYISVLDFGYDSKFLSDLEDVVSSLSRDNQAVIYITVTRAAMLEGKVKLATVLGRKSIGLLPNEPSYTARSSLYLAGTLTVSGQEKEARLLLAKVNRKLLGAQDMGLHDAFVLMLNEIQKPIGKTDFTENLSMKKKTYGKLGESNKEQDSKTIKKSIELMNEAAELLETKTYEAS